MTAIPPKRVCPAAKRFQWAHLLGHARAGIAHFEDDMPALTARMQAPRLEVILDPEDYLSRIERLGQKVVRACRESAARAANT